ncbi:MAG: aminodeoxychorismate synthase component I, partial [Desulfamplus sp.]|nr:aminodeoxychorismate synthase component I [Desulfamplus sp.]
MPWLIIRAWGDNILVNLSGRSFSFRAHPLDVVDAVVNHYRGSCDLLPRELHDQDSGNFTGRWYGLSPDNVSGVLPWSSFGTSPCSSSELPGNFPLRSALFGYLSYDLKDQIEVLPNTCMDQNLPDLYMCLPSFILIHDIHDGTFHELSPRFHNGESPLASRVIENPVSTDHIHGKLFAIDRCGFTSNFSKSEYIGAVRKIIEYIKAGDIYQANFSQRFSASFSGDTYSLFLKLFERNPAPFFSYINAGDHQIISTSPERFISQRGRYIETRPIKGTIRRGKNPLEDAELAARLQDSPKDDAELSMIVDLMRNDLGRVSTGGTVRVKEHKRLEPYDNVFHLVSIVQGELAPGKSGIDLLRAAFPGGSITGCPKIRSMEIIDELESVRRHIYTGSVGYISFHDTMDFSIAIRTAVVANGEIGFSVGGGIVFDSDPEKEYQETLHKGKTFMDILSWDTVADPLEKERGNEEQGKTDEKRERADEKREGADEKRERADEKREGADEKRYRAWVNGKIVPVKDAVIPAAFPGFQYGAGVFETIRVDKGRIIRLEKHLERLAGSWAELFGRRLPSITWSSVIGRLVEMNGL